MADASTRLRGPDPTLAALGMVAVQWGTRPLPTGHRIDTSAGDNLPGDERTVCGLVFRLHLLVEAKHAAYVAVPCRECFPDAPPPGHDLGCHPECASAPRPDRNLAWQTEENHDG